MLSAIKGLLLQRGERLGSARINVLWAMIESGRPMKAYALLDTIRTTMPGAGPATVYRALDFLVTQGIVVRLNTINAYLFRAPEEDIRCAYLVCARCGRVDHIPLPDSSSHWMLTSCASRFLPHSSCLEVGGTCRACINEEKPALVSPQPFA